MTAAVAQATAYERVLNALHQHGGRVQQRGRDAMAQCPAHDDRTPSLHITVGETRVLVRCHAGCDTDDVLAALRFTRADLFDEPIERPADGAGGDDWMPCSKRGHRQVAAYPYVDEDGQLLFTVHRCAHKCFAQSRPDPTAKSGRRWRLHDDTGQLLVRLVPYRLPQLLQAVADHRVIWIVEGEKDADVLANRALGVPATCSPGGAGKWRPDYNRYFHGADITIVADRDHAGRAHAEHITTALTGIASSIHIVQARHGKDAADHLAAGGHCGNFITVAEPVPYTGDTA